jgi:ribosomal protein L40E
MVNIEVVGELQMVYCQKCGAKNEYNASYCKECGNKLNFSNKSQENSSLLGSIRWPIILPVAIAIGLILIILSDNIIFLIIIIPFVGVGYLVNGLKNGAINGGVTGIISFLIGSIMLAINSYQPLFIILFTMIFMMIVGALYGIIFGGLGGYIKKITQ